MRSVPYFDYPFVFCSEKGALIEVIAGVAGRGAFIFQKELCEFEANLATSVGARYALGVANATDGLNLLVRAAGLGDGDEVVFCSHTMTATAAAIHFANATPVPVDCGPDHLIDPDSVRRAITPRTKAIMPTQLNGRTCDMDALMAIAEEHGLVIIEDAAQALGSRYKGRCAGTFGLGGAISFYPAKTLGCFGDGGAIVTNNEEIFEKVFLLRDHGRNSKGQTVCWGLNSRLDNLQAAILDHKLKSYDKVVDRRRALAALYQAQLGPLEQLVLPPAPDSDPDHFDIYQNYEIEAERRDEVKQFLADRGVGTLLQWGGKAVHQIEAFRFNVKLPNVERLFERCLMLPLNMSLSDDDVSYVCDTIKEFYRTR